MIKELLVNFFTITLLVMNSINIYSQVCIGNADYFNEKTSKNSIEEINNFKNTITVVVLPEKDRSKFDDIIKEYWDITKVEFVSLSEFEENKEKYTFPTYSYLKFETYTLFKKDGSYSENSVTISDFDNFYDEEDLYGYEDDEVDEDEEGDEDNEDNNTILYKIREFANKNKYKISDVEIISLLKSFFN
jgi:hypothetical protein